MRAAATGWALVVIFLAGAPAQAREVSLEYRLKAAYILNFTKFIEWPPEAGNGPFRLCLAVQNPFEEELQAIVRDETADARPIEVRVIGTPEPGCDVLFVPEAAPAAPFLQAARNAPTLTIGESPRFAAQGGVINFVLEQGSVRFQINAREAERAGLRVSSHLLRLARTPER